MKQNQFFLWLSVLLLFSCSQTQKSDGVYDPKLYRRVTSPVDSSKNMYVVYNCTKDSNYKMLKFYWDNGKIQSINFFFQNNKAGPWVGYFDNGKISFEQNFLDGRKEGNYKIYFMNGQLKASGTYRHDSKTGVWNYYNEDGALLKVEHYK